VEGKKTVAFEIAEQLGWRTPDVVAAPVGDACTLAAVGKGFRELREIGRTEAVPQLVGVQAAAMQPLVRRFQGESYDGGTGDSRAASINVRRPRNARRLLRELDASAGAMVAVPDDAIDCARRVLMEEAGIAAEFTSAAALAGLTRVARDGSLADRTVVVIITAGDRG
jgi:threonine synthase